MSEMLYRLCLLALLACVAFSASAVKKHDMEPFTCQVCSAFAHEYEKRIRDKATDDHPDILNNWCRGNASNYLWDEHSKVLRPRDIGRGAEVIDDVYTILDTKIMTPYVSEIALHALHSAAHRKNPAKAPYPFVWHVLCVEITKVCKENKEMYDGKTYQVLRHDFDNFRSIYEEPHIGMDTHPEINERHGDAHPKLKPHEYHPPEDREARHHHPHHDPNEAAPGGEGREMQYDRLHPPNEEL